MTDFDRKIRTIANEIASKQDSLARLRDDLDRARTATEELLSIAQSVGVNVISVSTKHESVGNEDWPFGYSGSIFTPQDDRIDGWPAAWSIAKKAGIYGGTGNTGQAQVDDRTLIDGVYECRDGQWIRIDGDH